MYKEMMCLELTVVVSQYDERFPGLIIGPLKYLLCPLFLLCMLSQRPVMKTNSQYFSCALCATIVVNLTQMKTQELSIFFMHCGLTNGYLGVFSFLNAKIKSTVRKFNWLLSRQITKTQPSTQLTVIKVSIQRSCIKQWNFKNACLRESRRDSSQTAST